MRYTLIRAAPDALRHPLESMIKLEKIEYSGWANCFRLSNGQIELIVTSDVGPRIIHFGFAGGENELNVTADQAGRTGGEEWRVYGGHRLWHAPEQNPRSYSPDNNPIRVEEHGEFIRTIQPIEATTGIEKEMDIHMAADAPFVRITHRLRNHNVWPLTMACWAITVVEKHGTAIMPLPPRGPQPENLLPTASIAIWPYTAMNDPRWAWGHRYIMLRQDPAHPYSQKAGVATNEGWVAYVRNNHLLAKYSPQIAGAVYPDRGCTVEVYADGNGLEIETLGPLCTVEPGSMIEHVERWGLFDGVPTPTCDDDVDTHIRPKIEQLM